LQFAATFLVPQLFRPPFSSAAIQNHLGLPFPTGKELVSVLVFLFMRSLHQLLARDQIDLLFFLQVKQRSYQGIATSLAEMQRKAKKKQNRQSNQNDHLKGFFI
jgi:hypothetical protein